MTSLLPALLLFSQTPDRTPRRLVLTWHADPAFSQAANWRTESPVEKAFGQIAVASPDPKFVQGASTVDANSQSVTVAEGKVVYYHTVRFESLKPDTLYAYRVGDGTVWSEWAHFRTASDKPEPFRFIYVGDAQNDIKSLWSRAIRGAFREASQARFILHSGDLINRANADNEWEEWFYAAGWVNAMVPTIATPGNHDYERNAATNQRQLSRLWQPQFEYPSNGAPGVDPETNYYVDFQGVRVISLNSMRDFAAQAAWLGQVLEKNPNRWTIATFHHPVFSLAGDRDNEELRNAWRPVLEKHRVDLVLQGHDHTYGRTKNLMSGLNLQDGKQGPVYVVSVSGPKMYTITKPENKVPMKTTAENTQLYQVLDVENGKIAYRAFTVDGKLFDHFELRKDRSGKKRLVEIKIR